MYFEIDERRRKNICGIFLYFYFIYVYFDVFHNSNNTLQVLAKIKSYDSMSEGNKAGIWAIRASVYIKYGYTGIIRAVEYMKKAISLDPNNAHWHFMKGKYLGRLRRMENVFTIPGNEEFSALKKAVHIKKDPYFIAFIAELYIEIAKGAKMSSIQKFINCDTKAKKQFHLKLNKFYEDAAKLFEYAFFFLSFFLMPYNIYSDIDKLC